MNRIAKGLVALSAGTVMLSTAAFAQQMATGRADLMSVDRPSQMRPPFLLSSVPKATSSISAPRMAARPPAASRADRRISMQPPAPAAVRLRGSLT